MIWQVTNAVVTVNKKKEEEENLFIYLCLWVKLFGEEEGRNGRPELDSLFQNRTDATSTNQQKKKKKKKPDKVRIECENFKLCFPPPSSLKIWHSIETAGPHSFWDDGPWGWPSSAWLR